MAKFYLGDGAYLQTDGVDVMLTTEDGVSVSNRIFLDVNMVNKIVTHINEVIKNEKS